MESVMMISKSTPTSGRIFGRDFIYRTRKVQRYYGITSLKLFTRIDLGKRSFYWSKAGTAFWNMQGVVATKARDYVIHATR
jgi:hypothetical protein